MNNAIMHAKIAGYKDENQQQHQQDLNTNFESRKEDCLSGILASDMKHGDVLPSIIKKLQTRDFATQKLFLQQMSVLHKRIPKKIMSVEEKYLRHCLELIHTSAMNANSWSMPSKVNIMPNRFSSRIVGGGIGCDDMFLVSSMDPILGSITRSTSMVKLLESPLLRQLGDSDDNTTNHRNTGNVEAREPISSSQVLQKKSTVSEDQCFGFTKPMHKRVISYSSTNSTFSDPSSSSPSSSSSSAYSQGMLHCSWNNGFPHYVFSVEDQREVYTTNLSKVDSFRDEGLDYIYAFHCSTRKRENEDQDSDLVAKMSVSTSFTLCSVGIEIMETQFILCATGHHSEGDLNTSNQTLKKNKGLSKKVASIFKGSHYLRQRTSSKFDGSFALQESFLEQSEEGNAFTESMFSSKLELAAIVVKDHIPYSQMKVEGGGWGLKFLKEGGHKQTNTALKRQSVPCEACRQNAGQHCSSMDVLVPAGFHGGPKTKNGRPSSLVERWRSGGSCDCGGWDIGCPLTILNAAPNNKDVLYQTGVFGKSNSFELFTQGMKQGVPVVEVTNIHDGLYYIHYQSSTISALQSLSIAVAIIHSHSPTLKPKVYRN